MSATNEISAGKLWGMRRMADANGRFKMLAVDQRPPIKNLVAERRGEDAPRFDDVAGVKQSLMKVLSPAATAVLADPHYAISNAITMLDPSCGLIMTLEDSRFTETDGGRLSAEIDDWSVEKIKRAGGDGVKVLTWHRPDASADVVQKQKDFSQRVGEACAKYDIPYVLEFLLYPLKGDENHTTDYVEQIGKRADQVIETVHEYAGADFGVDLFKLESPIAAADVPAPDSDDRKAVEACQDWFNQLNEASGRPWVMLSAGAKQEQFANVLHYAYAAGASGFLAGRAIWWQALQAFPDLAAFEQGLNDNGLAYFRELNAAADANARPWMDWFDGNPQVAGAGAGFRHGYPGFGDK